MRENETTQAIQRLADALWCGMGMDGTPDLETQMTAYEIHKRHEAPIN